MTKYAQFKLQGDVYSVGDIALFKNPDIDGLPFIGRIMTLYEQQAKTGKAGKAGFALNRISTSTNS